MLFATMFNVTVTYKHKLHSVEVIKYFVIISNCGQPSNDWPTIIQSVYVGGIRTPPSRDHGNVCLSK